MNKQNPDKKIKSFLQYSKAKALEFLFISVPSKQMAFQEANFADPAQSQQRQTNKPKKKNGTLF